METLNLLFDDTTNYVLYGGSKSCGKTRLLVLWSLIMCLKYPGCRGIWGRAHIQGLKRSTLNTFFEVCRELGLKKTYDYNFNPIENVIRFENGSEILLVPLFQKPSDIEFVGLGSVEATFACIDEAGEIGYDAYIALRNTLRFRTQEFGITPKILIVSNPTKNWLYDEFYKPWKDGTLPSNMKYVHTIPTDNSFNDPLYLKVLSEMVGSDYERLYLGNWDYGDDLNALFNFIDLSDAYHLSRLGGRPKKYLTIDVALEGDDDTCIVVWHDLTIKKIILVSIEDGPELVDYIKQVMKQYDVRASNVIYDAIGVGSVGSFLKGTVKFKASFAPIVNKEFQDLKAECFYLLAEYFKRSEILIDEPKYRDRLIGEFQAYKRYKVDDPRKRRITPKVEVKRQIKHSPDIADAIAMRMYWELQGDKPLKMITL